MLSACETPLVALCGVRQGLALGVSYPKSDGSLQNRDDSFVFSNFSTTTECRITALYRFLGRNVFRFFLDGFRRLRVALSVIIRKVEPTGSPVVPCFLLLGRSTYSD